MASCLGSCSTHTLMAFDATLSLSTFGGNVEMDSCLTYGVKIEWRANVFVT